MRAQWAREQVKSSQFFISAHFLPPLLASGAHSIGCRMVVCCLSVDLTLKREQLSTMIGLRGGNVRSRNTAKPARGSGFFLPKQETIGSFEVSPGDTRTPN